MADSITQALAGVKDAGAFTFTDLATGKPVLHINYANTFNLNLSSEFVSAKANGVDRVKFEQAKTGTGEIGVELMNFDLFALILSSPILTEEVDYFKREQFTVKEADEVVELKEAPKNNQISVYKIRKDGSTHISQLATASCTGKNATLTGAVEGDEVSIYYLTAKQGRHSVVKGTSENTKYYRVNGLVRMKSSEDGVDSFMEIELAKVAIQSSLDIEFNAETPSSFTIQLELMTDGKDNMIDLKEVV